MVMLGVVVRVTVSSQGKAQLIFNGNPGQVSLASCGEFVLYCLGFCWWWWCLAGGRRHWCPMVTPARAVLLAGSWYCNACGCANSGDGLVLPS